MNDRQTIRIFLASSGELSEERKQFPAILTDLNKTYQHLHLEPVKRELTQLPKDKESTNLIVLDQVEEMITNPHPGKQDEKRRFVKTLAEAQKKFPDCRFLLSFRKEYLAEIDDLLEEVNLPAKPFYLSRLTETGICEAIAGPVHLGRYNLLLDDEEMISKMAEDLQRDKESHIAPLQLH